MADGSTTSPQKVSPRDEALSSQWVTSESLEKSKSPMFSPYLALNSLLNQSQVFQCNPKEANVPALIKVDGDELLISDLDSRKANAIVKAINNLGLQQFQGNEIAKATTQKAPRGSGYQFTKELQIDLNGVDKEDFAGKLREATPTIANRVIGASLPQVANTTSL